MAALFLTAPIQEAPRCPDVGWYILIMDNIQCQQQDPELRCTLLSERNNVKDHRLPDRNSMTFWKRYYCRAYMETRSSQESEAGGGIMMPPQTTVRRCLSSSNKL